MSYPTFPWMLYKAKLADNGQTVVTDPRYLAETTRTIGSASEYDDALREGWFDSPQAAHEAATRALDILFDREAVRNYDDRHLSANAKAEADEVSRAAGFHPTEDIPEAPKKGRTKKGE